MRNLYLTFAQICRAALLLMIAQAVLPLAHAQTPPSSTDRDRARAMLNTIKNDLEKHYYDPNYHGMNLDERFKTAEGKIKEAVSLAQLFGIIGQVLLDLNDSHTFFLPPGRTYKTEYGWQMQMVGDRCYVSAVKPGSDAEAKGLKEGDEVVSVDGMRPSRENMWKIRYLYQAIRPRPGMRVVVIKPDGKEQQLDVAAKVVQGKVLIDYTLSSGSGADIVDAIREAENESRLNRHRYVEAQDVFIWKMPQFNLDKVQVDDMMGKVKKSKALVLDLRGNGGGYEMTLLRLIGNLFDREVKVGDIKRRKETKPLVAKSRGSEAFSGKVIVLIDSESGSAAELLARVVQLEKRGTVIGDRSAGAVMRSMIHSHDLGVDIVVPYAASITDADIIMTDGQSLEHTGVQPDELRLLSGADMAAKRDTVLAYAVSLAGITITPEKAGALFPIEWKK